MSYTLYDVDGETPIHVFHTDREVCDDDGCVCTLPSSAQVYAMRAADGRAEWFVSGRRYIDGPYSEAEAREKMDSLTVNGIRAKLLRVVEDYT